MTAAAGNATTAVLPPQGPSGAAAIPRLADGIELLGEYQGSGYAQPPSLVRRPDGQVIQMSRLLYEVTCRIDGSRAPGAIADLVGDDLGLSLSGDQVRHLITSKLLPLGIVAAEGAPAAAPKANPLLALGARRSLLPRAAANAVGVLLRPLFRPPIIVAVVGSVLAVDAWLFVSHGLGVGLQQVLQPGGPAHRGRPQPGLRRIPRVRARGGLPLWRGAIRSDRRRHLPRLALVLH